MVQQIQYGNEGASDCRISGELRTSGGRQIALRSKVKALFGKQILEQVHRHLDRFEIENIELDIVDEGALDWVLAARLDACLTDLSDTMLPPAMDAPAAIETERARPRRSRLYLPGNSPKLMLNAGVHMPDGIILDLEDAVAPAKKREARFLVRHALLAHDFLGAERMVRINQLPQGLEDLNYCIPYYANLILIPKCESGDQVKQVDEEMHRIMDESATDRDVWLMPIIESALGVVKAFEIASACPSVAAMAIGLEDYTADLGTGRSREAWESFYARSAVVNAAKAAGIQAIDSVFSDVTDMEALAENIRVSKGLGFDGMGCIHPRQIDVIHEGYAPGQKEIDKALAICGAFMEAEKKGLGVVSLGSKMIDAPVVKI